MADKTDFEWDENKDKANQKSIVYRSLLHSQLFWTATVSFLKILTIALMRKGSIAWARFQKGY